MCVVSMVMDYPAKTRGPEWWPLIEDSANLYQKPVGLFDNWDYEACLVFVELVETAHKFDQINTEPKCYDKNKTERLNKLHQRVSKIGLEQSGNTNKCLKLCSRIETLIEELK